MIRLENINKIYQQETNQIIALRDVNLTVATGSIAGVIGQSGAGKSTLIRCVNLLERPTDGKVFINEQEITQLNAARLRQIRHHIGMIFQHFNLLASRTVFANIALPLELMHINKQDIHTRVEELLSLTNLQKLSQRYPNQLSGGQKQRVAIARALASKPDILLCDEATSALDPYTTQSILNLLRTINQRLGLTILLITHEMEVAKAICEQVSLIENGQIIETASAAQFFSAPKTETAQRFINQFMQLELPNNLQNQLVSHFSLQHQHPLLRLTFIDQDVTTPIITQLARQFAIDINIHQARVEIIQNHTLGMMIAELLGDEKATQEVIAQLRKAHVKVEVLGYV